MSVDVLPAARSVELVDGELGHASVPLGGVLEDPDNGARRGEQLASTDATVERALAVAHESWLAGDGWSAVPAAERAERLERLAGELDARAEEIAVADAVESGVPLAVTGMIAGSLGAIVRGVVAQLRRAEPVRRLEAGGRRVELLRLPWGPAVLLTPWNAPAAAAAGKVANALAAGCPAILKPSEHAPTSSGALAEAARAAGLPAGALQVVHGGPAVAARLVGDPRVRCVALTGGQAAGRAVAAAAAPRMAALQLELGGSNPAVVLAGADPAAAAAALVEGMTKLNGQWCEAPRRVLVEAQAHDALVDALREALGRVTVGSWREAVDVGPLAHRAHFKRVQGQVARIGGERWSPVAVDAPGGCAMAPVLITGAPASAVTEEVFGPVLTVHAVAGPDEAVRAANALGDGLAGYVFAGDADEAFALGRRLHAGEVRLGGTHLVDLAGGSAQSFWGTSGIGGHGAAEVLEAFRGTRIVGEDDPALPI
jgi:betaine-aldehyde dehydrogenase